MQITFDTTTITDDEVRGIFALLDTVRPEAFDPGPFSESEMERAVDEKIVTLKGSGTYEVQPEDKGATFVTPSITVSNGPIEVQVPRGPEATLTIVPDTDANGLPWDERIHASSKALNADGTWRTKRGVDKALVASVEAELRQTPTPSEVAENLRNEGIEAEAISGEIHISAPPAPPAPEAPTAPLAPAVTESAPVETAPQTPSVPVAPSSAVSPFVALMKRVTTAQGAGKLTQPRVKELLESLDKKSIMDLRTDEDALASFAVLLDSEGV